MADVGHVLDDVLFKVDVFFLKVREVLFLIDVDEVKDVTNALMLLLLPAVLDDQGDVEVNLCDLL